ncbi:RES family NAD+ phosphorylase [Pedobacter sp. SYSU D00535]|uniref:RES family NAD+ phosphorylase n=1 Tax=Pedobacter sp. SYSU D00535 TaxID=2810308 RepID=UPI001A978FAB
MPKGWIKNPGIALRDYKSRRACERIKSLGFDAVEYKSAMNPSGYNLALFNDAKVEYRVTRSSRLQISKSV